MMGTFKAYLKKEIMESTRQYRYLVLAVGILLFALLDPIMLKLLPTILKNQLPGDIASLFVTTPVTAIQSYIKDLFQIGSLFIALSLMGILSDEVSNQKLVFPYSKGSSPWGIVVSKAIHYSVTIAILIIAGFLISYYYSNLLFTGQSADISLVLNSALLVALYYIFNISLIIFFSSIFKRGIAAGIAVLFISYFQPLLLNINMIKNYVPYRLVEQSYIFSLSHENILITILSTIVFCGILNALSIYRMNKVEVIQKSN